MGNVDITKWKRVGYSENTNAQNSPQQAEIDKLTNDIFTAQNDKTQATEQQNQAKETLNTDVESRNEAIQTTVDALGSLQSELSAAAANVNACSAALSSITIPELVPTTTKKDETTGEEVTVQGNEAEVAAALQAQAQAAADLAAAQAQMQEVQALCEETSAALADEKSALEGMQSEKDAQVQEFEAKIQEFDANIQEMKTQLEDLKTEVQNQLEDFGKNNDEFSYDKESNSVLNKDGKSIDGHQAQFVDLDGGAIQINSSYVTPVKDEKGNIIGYTTDGSNAGSNIVKNGEIVTLNEKGQLVNQNGEVVSDDAKVVQAGDDGKYRVGEKNTVANRGVADNSTPTIARVVDELSRSELFEAGMKDHLEQIACGVKKLTENEQWRIGMDVNNDGVMDDVALAEAVAASFDSELDLYIQDIVTDVMFNQGFRWGNQYLSDKALDKLAEYGIRVDVVGCSDGKDTNRVFSYSLMDTSGYDPSSGMSLREYIYSDDAKVVLDENGNEASYLFADALIPDGMAQTGEVHMSSILDKLGYECTSRSDFIGREQEYYDLMDDIGANLYKYVGGTKDLDDIYQYHHTNVSQALIDLHNGKQGAPGYWGVSAGYTGLGGVSGASGGADGTDGADGDGTDAKGANGTSSADGENGQSSSVASAQNSEYIKAFDGYIQKQLESGNSVDVKYAQSMAAKQAGETGLSEHQLSERANELEQQYKQQVQQAQEKAQAEAKEEAKKEQEEREKEEQTV